MRYFRYALIFIFLLATPIVHAATIDVPAGNVAALIAAINTANASPNADIINLGGGVYTLTQVNNSEFIIDLVENVGLGGGSNGLPVIRGTLTINGNGAVIERAETAPEFRIMLTYGDVTLNNLTLRNGLMTNSEEFRSNVGGAIFNLGDLIINDSTFVHNEANGGGAIFNFLARLTIQRSVISNNRANYGGGGVSSEADDKPLTILYTTIADNSTGAPGSDLGIGGGLSLGSGNITIQNSTISGNIAEGTGLGGGLYMVDGFYYTRDISSNTTISGNTARLGGGIFNSDGRFTVNNITIANNTALENGGGVFSYDDTFFGFKNTIIADNQPNNCNTETNFGSEGGNLDTDGSCGLHNDDLSNVPALLAPLAYNGGFTQTHALIPGSRAINRGNIATCKRYDQRGILRDSSCDIGAFEAVEYAPLLAHITTDNSSLTWSRISWAVGYQVEIDNNPNFRSVNFRSEPLSPDTLSYLMPPLTNGIWYWHVRAQLADLTWGSWSSPQIVVVAIQ